MNRTVRVGVWLTVALLQATRVPAENIAAPQLPIPGALNEERFIPIGGIEQWITIKGDDRANPVVLMLHGGPGNTLSPFADAIYGAWEKQFTLVQWDQRAAGKTFGRNRPAEDDPLTLELMVKDGVAVAEYLRDYFGGRKVILMGGSWGSALGVHMIHTRPDLFAAYIGTSQLVERRANQTASYRSVLELARGSGDDKTRASLEAMGEPPWTDPRNPGILRRATRAYEAKATTPAPSAWWTLPPRYATKEISADYEAGDDYSYLQFVGLKGEGMFSQVDLTKLGPRFEIPIFIIQGAEDLVTVLEVTRGWFSSVEAPQKELMTIERAGHDPNEAVIAAQRAALQRISDR